MGDAVLLIDSDAFLLLAGTGLLDRALQLLNFDKSRVFRLPPLPHMIGRSASIKKRYRADARLAAQLACTEIKGVAARPDDDLLQQLIAVPEIDEGEALLYGLLAERPTCLLASGDKRAMVALGTRPEVASIRQMVASRVICLETVLRLLVIEDGPTAVGGKLLNAVASHKTLEVVFSPRNINDQKRCLAALDSYIADLKRQVGQGFLYEP